MDYAMYKAAGLLSSSKGPLKIMDHEFKMRSVIRLISTVTLSCIGLHIERFKFN